MEELMEYSRSVMEGPLSGVYHNMLVSLQSYANWEGLFIRAGCNLKNRI